MGKVTWTAENDRKLLLNLINPNVKDINYDALAKLFEGATPKAILEHCNKLRREAKTATAAAQAASGPTPPATPSFKGKGVAKVKGKGKGAEKNGFETGGAKRKLWGGEVENENENEEGGDREVEEEEEEEGSGGRKKIKLEGDGDGDEGEGGFTPGFALAEAGVEAEREAGEGI